MWLRWSFRGYMLTVGYIAGLVRCGHLLATFFFPHAF
jgi:hypothetical protein